MQLRYPWSLAVDDLLTTRLMEIAVHSDDLAASVGIPTPDLPPAVLAPVIDLLTRLAVRRHGTTAILRALSRTERAPPRSQPSSPARDRRSSGKLACWQVASGTIDA